MTDRSMQVGVKAGIVLGAGYALTLLLAGVLCGVAMIALQPHGCAAYGRALLVLWGILGATACLGVGTVGVLSWRLALGTLARVGMVAGFSIALLGTLVVVAFGLLVAFNC